MRQIENKTFDKEREFYGQKDLILKQCAFEGPADGESALKECKDITTENCRFDLRYPFWHDDRILIKDCIMTENCRAALWYSENIKILDSKLNGIKALRECRNVEILNTDIISPEFGWSVKNIRIKDSSVESEYFMMRSEDLFFEKVKLNGKYSFQYDRNGIFENCEFDTKDAFWHAENMTIRNSIVKGEYLAWYSKNLTFENCTIIGTQPFCYCENLKLINCQMIDCDLAFEKSDVKAEILGKIESIKNPRTGYICAGEIGEIIRDDENSKAKIFNCNCMLRSA